MDASTLLHQIHIQQQSAPLSILTLAEPLLQHQHNQQDQQQQPQNSPSPSRPSNASSSATDLFLTPSTLSADLAHYRDLFAKLRFSYSEQVTKERYLKSIVGDPPTLHTAEENAMLEERVAVMKKELKEKKEGVDALVEEMQEVASRVAGQWEQVEEGRIVLETVPMEVEGLREEVEKARELVEKRRVELGGEDGEVEPRYTMGLERTKEAVEERRLRNEEMEREIERLKNALETKGRECERAERELEETERRRNEVTRQARELKKLREEGGRDFVGEKGRWYGAQCTVMNGLLEV